MTGTIANVVPVSAETSTGGYTKFPDGTLFQWGSTTIPAGSYIVRETLPIPFIKKGKIAVSVTPVLVETNVFYGVDYNNLTESQLSFGRTPNTTAKTVYWTAIGRWK